ncbi:UNVERIFIED_CONTAM: copper amine oxidase-like protein [Acetivibrio alkalicellulosi]
MKKIYLLVCCFFMVAFLNVSTCFAQSNIVESPNVKININGKASTYSNVPIIVSGRTLLPFREISQNLGVDDNNIIWNASEKSVTVHKDSIKIYLKIGDTTAYVNDQPVIIDVAPIIYKYRTYIPVRFISQSFGMKVGWDSISHTVLIKNESDYNEIKDILTNVDQSMNSLKSYRSKFKGDLKISIDTNYISKQEIISESDNIKRFLYFTLKSSVAFDDKHINDTIKFFSDGVMAYTNVDNEWYERMLDNEESEGMFSFEKLASNDLLSTGLSIDNSDLPDTIVLKGNIDIKEFTQSFLNLEQIEGCSFNSVSAKMIIDRNTYHVLSVQIEAVGTSKSLDGSEFNLLIECEYMDFDTDIEILAPDGLIVG